MVLVWSADGSEKNEGANIIEKQLVLRHFWNNVNSICFYGIKFNIGKPAVLKQNVKQEREYVILYRF